MDYKTKALDHVRSVCPELMELSFEQNLDEVFLKIKEVEDKKIQEAANNNQLYAPQCREWAQIGRSMLDSKIIGHTPHPHHWLKALVEATNDTEWMLNHHNELVNMKNYGNKHFKNKYMIIGHDNFWERYCNECGL